MRAICLWIVVLACGMALSATPVLAAGLQDDINQAATIIERFQAVPEKGIPRAVLKDARGLAIMTVINPTTSLECVDQICTRRIAALQSQATRESGF